MQQQPGSYLKSIRILHNALLGGQVAFLAIVIFIRSVKPMSAVSPSLDKTLQVAALLVAFVAGFWAIKTFRSKLLDIRNAESISDKAQQYRVANIMLWAILEVSTLFAIICFFLTGNYAFVALATALVIFFAMQMPSRIKTMLHLQLSEEEVDGLS